MCSHACLLRQVIGMGYMAGMLGGLVGNQSDREMPVGEDGPRTPTLASISNAISAQLRSFWDKPCAIHVCRKRDPKPYFLGPSTEGRGCDPHF